MVGALTAQASWVCRGDAEVNADPLHGRKIRLGPAAAALEHAFEAGDRADDEADILAALALQDPGLNLLGRRVGGGERRQQREALQG